MIRPLSVFLLSLSCCVSVSAAAPSVPDISGTVDFPTIERLSELYRVMRYETNDQIQATCAKRFDDFALVDLPETRNRYMIGTLNGARRQEIWIRGTANFRNALYDLRFLKHRNEKLGINLHSGFEQMALAVYQDIRPRLKRGYQMVIFGHSLGAAEAVILAMLMDVDGYRVSKVYASGQPRVTDLEGEKKFDHLPILRIVNEGDPVPFLPPRDVSSATEPYVHLGNALVLLDGPYYCLLGEDMSDEVLAGDFWKALTLEGHLRPVNDHFIAAYLARIVPKLKSAIQVPYAERYSHVTPKKK